jgi:hypothetical protein
VAREQRKLTAILGRRRCRLLAADCPTVVSEDGYTVLPHRFGPALDVRFRCRAQCCQYIGGGLDGHRYSTSDDFLVVVVLEFPLEVPLGKFGAPTSRNKDVSLRLG